MFQPAPERPLPINSFPRRPTPREVIERVLAWHPGITHADVVGPRKVRAITRARFDCIAAVRHLCATNGRPLSTPTLGRLFGGRDHSTIVSALRRQRRP